MPSTVQRAVMMLVLGVAFMARAQGRVSVAPMMKETRQQHTATVLADGRVLVCGGRGADGLSTLKSCELFEPKKNRWVVAAPMVMARALHTATLLVDGRVLVTGGLTHDEQDGANRFVAIDGAEVYEPKKNVWSLVAAMHDARNGHTATLLDDGSVLVVGGAREQRVHLASVERFDPKTATWAAAAPLTTRRFMHAAVKDSAGNVVVVGGRSNASQAASGTGISIADVERFEVKRGVWEPLPAMSEPRQRMAVLALPGDEVIVVIGGQTGNTSTNYAELWKPGFTEWKALENHLSMSLSSHSATLLPSGDVVVVGGEPPNQVDTGRVQRWSATGRQWCLAGELNVSRKLHTATLLNDGRVLVLGGTSAGLAERSAELWSPTTGKCEEPPGVNLGW